MENIRKKLAKYLTFNKNLCIIIIGNKKPQSGCHGIVNNHSPGQSRMVIIFIAYVVDTRWR